MKSFRPLRFAMILLVLAAGSTACGDEDETETQTETQASMGREGPEGCYVPADMLCDCDIEEAACTEGVGVWTPGCESCAE